MPANGTLPRDIASAYAVTAARLTSWLIVSALVFRSSTDAYALLVLVRATIGVLNYTALGLAPAMIHSLSRAHRVAPAADPLPAEPVEAPTPLAPVELAYATTAIKRTSAELNDALRRFYANGLTVACFTTFAGVLVTIIYRFGFTYIHEPPGSWFDAGPALVYCLGIGTVLRLATDAPGAALQTEGRIFLDNCLLVATEIVWIAIMAFTLTARGDAVLYPASLGFLLASIFLVYARFIAADRHTRMPGNFFRFVEWSTARSLLAFGSLVALAQVADYLYAPTDYILINRLLTPDAVATYAPAVQIDGGLMLLVSGLSTVLLPTAAIAHAAGDAHKVRRYYVLGTLASAAMLLPAAAAIYFLSPILFKLWLGRPLPATQAILPLLLIHTVIGGSSAVGRSILLAMGKVKPFTTAVLIAGIANVILSFCFVRFLHLGLTGIILGTIAAVVGRCAIWMPWYTLKCLKQPIVIDDITAMPAEL